MFIDTKALEFQVGSCLVKTFKLDEMEMKSRFNQHTNLIMIVEVDGEIFKNIKPNLYNNVTKLIVRNKGINIFEGVVFDALVNEPVNNMVSIRLEAFDSSIILNDAPKQCIYQDKTLTYKNIIDDILRESNMSYVVSKKFNISINRVFRQLETDWNFLVRLCSNLGEAIFVTSDGVIIFGSDCISNVERVL